MTIKSGERKKVGIIGAGPVGAATAFVLTIHNIADEIILIDRNESRARGEALDISFCVPFVNPKIVRAGNYDDLADADLIIVTASIPTLSKKNGKNITVKNLSIIRDIAENIKRIGFDGILLNMSNPVDLLTYAFYKMTELPANQVLGGGTVLDTTRLRFLLGINCGFDPRSIHIHIIGEHGNNEVPVWSQANIAGSPLKNVCCNCNGNCSCVMYKQLFDESKSAGYFISKGKGNTNYSIAMSALSIVRAIFHNENRVLPVSTLMEGYLGINDVYLSMPSVINRNGIKRVIKLELNDIEEELFLKSAKSLQKEALRYQIE